MLVEHARNLAGIPDAVHAEYGAGGTAVISPLAQVRAIERVDHPFFLATLYQPQLRSEPGRPHPVFVGLLNALTGTE